MAHEAPASLPVRGSARRATGPAHAARADAHRYRPRGGSRMDLQDYPRPRHDNGRGIHWFPTLGQRRTVVDQNVARLGGPEVALAGLLERSGRCGPAGERSPHQEAGGRRHRPRHARLRAAHLPSGRCRPHPPPPPGGLLPRSAAPRGLLPALLRAQRSRRVGTGPDASQAGEGLRGCLAARRAGSDQRRRVARLRPPLAGRRL